ncbi:MAG: restriction endonuclease subunit S [Sulfuricaulis sp.]|uniref:restriction endonuclease subunit S n=1 Tax=Sulfuricaulis sp. TaxID=2003553 RepID=UPI0025E69BA7|nr:restriction endonuclease subunit S [Sulfuricaulis sp.]MCR4347038.1 restriction endonuclease subunit S [Sulfuricaulis sp.]
MVEVLTPISREEVVDPVREYRLLGVRLDGQGPFLREMVLGSETAANKLFCVAAGDFIYSRLFAWRGAFGIIEEELDGCYVSGEFPTFAPIANKIDIRFLRYWFRLSGTLDRVSEDCSGSTPLTRNRFKEKFFLSLEIPLPPLAEQRRIVARIEELAAKIAEARSLRQQTTAEVEAFVISVHAKLAAKRTKKLGEVLKLDEDAAAILPTGSYPQVGMRSFGGGLFPKGAVAGMETTYRAFNRLYEGALVLSQVKGWEGAVAVCPTELAGWFVSPEYRTFRCIPSETRPGYLGPLVRTEWFWGKLAHATRGVGARRERTRPEQFLEIELPMPDVEHQKRGEMLFAQVDALKRLQVETVAELDAMLPAILDRAFKGELR